jgi:hypothetical protein
MAELWIKPPYCSSIVFTAWMDSSKFRVSIQASAVQIIYLGVQLSAGGCGAVPAGGVGGAGILNVQAPLRFRGFRGGGAAPAISGTMLSSDLLAPPQPAAKANRKTRASARAAARFFMTILL